MIDDEDVSKAVRRKQRRQKQKKEPEPQFWPSKPLKFKTARQRELAEAIACNTYIFAVGPAGTGKTYLSAHFAADHLRQDDTKVVITRPAVEAAGEKLGSLPGNLNEKTGPYVRPFLDELGRNLGHKFVKQCINTGRVEVCPLAYMRGRSFENTMIVADEMQNASVATHKMLMTRLGSDSRMIISGDPEQADIPDSGLQRVADAFDGEPHLAVVRFADGDSVRNQLTKTVLRKFKQILHSTSS